MSPYARDVAFEIRTAGVRDAEALARVCLRSRRAGFPAFMPADQVDGRAEAQRAAQWRERFCVPDPRWFVLVADDARAVLGYCMAFAPSCDADAGPEVGELAALYIDPDAWGRGVGSALVTALFDRLRDEGYSRVTVWPHADNAAACRLYLRLGFTPDGARFPEQTTGLTLLRLTRPLVHSRWRRRRARVA
jgi:RimJ/RimL family protein N-acetyltransferase